MGRRISALIGFIAALLALTFTAQAQVLPGDMIQRIARSVVYIEAEPLPGSEWISTGSGTIISPTGLIYTNRHVIEDSGDSFAIHLQQDIGELPELAYYASLVATYNEIDFAILQIDQDANGRPIDPNTLNLPYLDVFEQNVNLGERVTIFGYPSIGNGYLVVTQGSITSVENESLYGQRIPGLYRTDAEISPGNSGGLAVNLDGEFVGIPTEVYKEEETLGRLGGILPFVAIDTVMKGRQERIDSGETIPTLTIENRSETVICYVFIAPTTSTSWGSDQLGNNEVIAPGDKKVWDLEAGEYDILLEDCERNELLDSRENNITEPYLLTYGSREGSTNPNNNAPDAGGLTAQILDIEHNVTLDDRPEVGMRIHVYLRANGYQGTSLKLQMNFFWEDGTPISGANASSLNRGENGELIIESQFAPRFEDTEWADYWIWLPYDSFPKGLSGEQTGYVVATFAPEGSNSGATSDPYNFVIIYPE